ncbi:MCE family protein [Amycolatopsis cihanbeyliensis]|uniref:Phospholipid/cholesterol/gamma-HCH transport system substrate-binding protein n=1 Tax=Amycolatopsis cihanbeyliensis TaxID=1128664 RepID=A0A542DR24_AMYCI|nr:MCE family protein [Amycolatopsis cihanbeyliensis]TQJ05551.1 phospholipid/cholesterol/gamma-HCH transport system substrate-binding protein [Amycolatopsis cihanbeyliensis]
MLTKLVRWQVLIFCVIALVGVSYVGANYVGLQKLLFDSGYVVHARFVSGGGMFTNSEVTYRGVRVGRVGELRLTEAGMEADLVIEPDAPPIPADLDAVVASRSAAGEQYVDLRPRAGDGPMLRDGSVIVQDRTDIPLQVDTVLMNLDALVQSVPKPALRTVVDELYQATSGAGPNLQTLVDSGIDFIQTATEYVPQVTSLVTDSETVLATQVRNSEAIKSFGSDARALAEQLKKSDGDLREVITAVPPVAREVQALVRESGPRLGVLLANLLTVSTVAEVRQGGLEQLLVKAPEAVAAGSQVIRGDGAHFGLALTFFDPPPCTSGYGGTQYRDGLDTSPGGPLNTGARCTLPKGNPTGVRGSQNAPGG